MSWHCRGYERWRRPAVDGGSFFLGLLPFLIVPIVRMKLSGDRRIEEIEALWIHTGEVLSIVNAAASGVQASTPLASLPPRSTSLTNL
jgi:hypothetical protein